MNFITMAVQAVRYESLYIIEIPMPFMTVSTRTLNG